MFDNTLLTAWASFQMFTGDTVALEFTVTDIDGGALDLTGAETILWRAARNESALPLLSKALASGIIVTDAIGGVFEVRLSPEDTIAFAAGRYYHEAKVITATGDVVTMAWGYMTVASALIRGEFAPAVWPPDPPTPADSGLIADGVTPTPLLNRINQFAIVAIGGLAELPAIPSSSALTIGIINRGNNPLGVMPPSGGQVEDLGADVPLMVEPGASIELTCFDPVSAPGRQWYVRSRAYGSVLPAPIAWAVAAQPALALGGPGDLALDITTVRGSLVIWQRHAARWGAIGQIVLQPVSADFAGAANSGLILLL